MGFNIDEDPINANWLRWKSWSVGCENLLELLKILRIEASPREVQVRELMRLNNFYGNAPELLNIQLREFLSGVEIIDLTTEKSL